MHFQQFPSLPGAEPGIDFASEETDFELEDTPVVENWLTQIIEQEDKILRLLNFIFCSDEYLLQLNKQYLDHDTLTDVITFQYADAPYIEGDIYISIDRIRENASRFKVPFLRELYRVMAHGVLHLCGYGDKTPEETRRMRQKENEALTFLPEQLR